MEPGDLPRDTVLFWVTTERLHPTRHSEGTVYDVNERTQPSGVVREVGAGKKVRSQG